MSHLTDVLEGINAALTASLEENAGLAPCWSGLHPGALVPADYCSCTPPPRAGATTSCGGMAWTRLAQAYPSGNSFPQPDTTPGGCNAPLAVPIEVGVLRCVPVFRAGGRPPTAAQQTAAAAQAALDVEAMHCALTSVDLRGRKRALGTYLPVTSGDCAGGTWIVTVQMVRHR